MKEQNGRATVMLGIAGVVLAVGAWREHHNPSFKFSPLHSVITLWVFAFAAISHAYQESVGRAAKRREFPRWVAINKILNGLGAGMMIVLAGIAYQAYRTHQDFVTLAGLRQLPEEPSQFFMVEGLSLVVGSICAAMNYWWYFRRPFLGSPAQKVGSFAAILFMLDDAVMTVKSVGDRTGRLTWGLWFAIGGGGSLAFLTEPTWAQCDITQWTGGIWSWSGLWFLILLTLCATSIFCIGRGTSLVWTALRPPGNPINPEDYAKGDQAGVATAAEAHFVLQGKAGQEAAHTQRADS